MIRATLIVILMAMATTTVAADPLPVPFGGGSCPFGYTKSGSFCVPSAGASYAIAKPPSGSCPFGWVASGNSCLRSGSRN